MKRSLGSVVGSVVAGAGLISMFGTCQGCSISLSKETPAYSVPNANLSELAKISEIVEPYKSTKKEIYPSLDMPSQKEIIYEN